MARHLLGLHEEMSCECAIGCGAPYTGPSTLAEKLSLVWGMCRPAERQGCVGHAQ